MDARVHELVEQARSGDPQAFAELITRFERMALALAYSGVSDAESAADVVQEAMLRAWKRIGDLKEPQRFGPWLGGIVRNLAADHRRKRKLTACGDDVPEAQSGPEADPIEHIGRQETQNRLSAALHKLDEVSRSAVMLRYYEGYSSREIAQLLEISPAAVDMRLSRARAELRELLAGDVLEC